MIECPYITNCSSYPHKCNTCRHNTSKKRDYYEPDYYHWYPWVYPRRWPWYPYEVWCESDNDKSTITYMSDSTSSKKKKDYYKKR